MALYRIEVRIHSRSKGGGMIAASAYRAAERLHEPGLGPVAFAVHAGAHIAGERLEEEHGRVWDYTRKAGVLHSEIVLPDGAPDRFQDRQTLWAEAEKAERRCDAQVGREFILTLPRELDTAANVELVRGFARDSLAARGMAVDFAVHQARATDGLPHVHAHVLCAMRRCDESGFTTKDRGWNARGLFNELRHEWEHAQNHALELAQVAERVSCERLEVQLGRAFEVGDFERVAQLDREPVPYLPRETWMTERDAPGSTELGRARAEVQALNRERAAVYETVREIAEDVPDAPASFLAARAASADAFSAFESWSGWAREQLERVAELARDVAEMGRGAAERVLAFAEAGMTAVSDGLRDLFGRLHEADDRGLTRAREEVRQHGRREQERVLERAVEQLREREAAHQERQHERQHQHRGLELGG